ncbi:MAG: DUF2207 domain-containing protein [Candidatus Cloacimonetes bacterium]|nr:DUF2207 domain-containing protein [Candidatus Cloacimonadota bacterium]
MKKLILMTFLIFLFSAAFAESFYAKDYYCRINVRDNGDLRIRETFQYHFPEGSFTWVEREIPDRYTDGIVFIRAFLKTESGEIIKECSDFHYKHGNLVMRWDFESVVDSVLNFELEFDALKVCYEENDMLFIRWQSIPQEHEFPIDIGSVEMLLPREIEPVMFLSSGDNRIQSGYNGNQIWWNLSNLQQNETFICEIALPSGSLPIEQPQWQLIQAKAEVYIKIYVWLGVLTGILLLSLLIFVIYDSRRVYKRYAPEVLPEDMLAMHPALVSKLVNSFDASTIPFAAIFLRLLKSGSVNLNKQGKNRYFYEPTDQVPADEFDRRFYEILQEQYAKGKKDLKKVFMSLEKYKNKFSKQLTNWHFANGFASEEGHNRQKNILYPFLGSIILMVISLITSIIMMEQDVLWVMLITFVFCFLTVYFGYRISKIDLYTSTGFQRKFAWKLWKKEMLRQIKDNSLELENLDFDQAFGFAMVMGFADAYLKYFKKAGIDISESEVLKSFEDYESFQSFIVWYAAVASTTGASGSAGAGGASAGGGSASAG